MGILAALVIGAIAGWLAGLIVRGAGFGLIGNIVIGIIGALVASWLLPQLGVRRSHHSRHPLAGQARLTTLHHPRNDRRDGGRFLFSKGALVPSRTNNKANAR